MSYQYILLDWDGCLAKTLDLWLNVYKEIVGKRGIKVENDLNFVKKSFGLWARGFANVGVKDPEKAYQEALKKVEKDYIKVDLYEGTIELLAELRRRMKKTALVTSSFRYLVLPALKNTKTENFFDVILTRDDVKKGKPNPEIISEALKKLGGLKEEAVNVGDSYHDVQTGKNAGVPTIIFYPEENEKFYTLEELQSEKPDYLVRDFKELLDIIVN